MEFRATTEVESDPGIWYVRGEDAEGKPIRYRIRRLPGDVEQALITESLGNRKASKDEAQATVFSRTVARLRKRAVLALVESENLVIQLLDNGAAERLGGKPGEPTVRMDGHWTSDLKDQFCRLFPSEQTWVNERLDALASLDREQEVEESKT